MSSCLLSARLGDVITFTLSRDGPLITSEVISMEPYSSAKGIYPAGFYPCVKQGLLHPGYCNEDHKIFSIKKKNR